MSIAPSLADMFAPCRCCQRIMLLILSPGFLCIIGVPWVKMTRRYTNYGKNEWRGVGWDWRRSKKISCNDYGCCVRSAICVASSQLSAWTWCGAVSAVVVHWWRRRHAHVKKEKYFQSNCPICKWQEARTTKRGGVYFPRRETKRNLKLGKYFTFSKPKLRSKNRLNL